MELEQGIGCGAAEIVEEHGGIGLSAATVRRKGR
jgi:hypothetical protein